MTVDRLSTLAGAVLSLGLAGSAMAQSKETADSASGPRIVLAQAQTQPTEEEKKKREAERKKGPPPPQKAQPPQPPPAAKAVPPKSASPPPQERRTQSPPTPPRPPAAVQAQPAEAPKAARPSFGDRKEHRNHPDATQPVPVQKAAPALPPAKRELSKPVTPPPVGAPPVKSPAATSPAVVPPAVADPGVTPGKDLRKRGQPATGSPVMESVPGATPKAPFAGAQPPGAPAASPPPAAGAQRSPSVVPAAAVAPRFDDLKKGRQQTVEDGGRRTVIQEPGNRIIVKQDNRTFIQSNDGDRFSRQRDARVDRRPDGRTETSYVRSDGSRVVSEVDGSGRLLRRYRSGPDGREHNIIDNRRFWRNAAIGVGVGAIAAVVAINLARPVVTIPRNRYIVDYDRASDDDLYEALSAPPVDRLDRAYSLEEIRYNHALRERMRRIDLDAITFDFGAYQIAPDQYPKLERLARTINRVLRANPDEVFLVEGHTDAVGSEVDNLSLSDRRAEAVAQVLSESFGVPPENLVTQGYGEQNLKVETAGPERFNRRVAVRRITPLMAER